MSGGRVGVLQGGVSPEREVSLQSGGQIVSALRRGGEDVVVIDPQEDGWLTQLRDGDLARVFNVLHGGAGEDGSMRGLLNCLRIPCTGSGVLGSAVAMDKNKCKAIWRGAGLPTANWTVVAAGASAQDVDAAMSALPMPYFVKPLMGGSSLDAAIIRDAESCRAMLTGCAQAMMIESHIVGDDYTVGILEGEALPVIHIVPPPPSQFYDYHAKYVADDTQFHCPCDLDLATQQQMRDLSLRAFDAIGCSHWGRADLMMSEAGDVYLLEVNTVPGMTSHSLVPKAAEVAGLSFDALAMRILAGAYCDA